MRHRGHKKAIIAAAHTILRIAHHLFGRQVDYQDLVVDYFDRRHTERMTHRAIHLLERQGYHVVLQSAA
jgi:hypothetical protein